MDADRSATATSQLAAAACAPAPVCTTAAKSAGFSEKATVAAAPAASVTRWYPLQHRMQEVVAWDAHAAIEEVVHKL